MASRQDIGSVIEHEPLILLRFSLRLNPYISQSRLTRSFGDHDYSGVSGEKSCLDPGKAVPALLDRLVNQG
jgi:hypothetical protein